MRLSQSLNDALMEQAIKEYQNVLIYKAVESYFEDKQLKNLAKYFGAQAQHEKEHGDLFIQHINGRVGGKVNLMSVPFPAINIENDIDVGRIYLSVEEETTKSIESLYGLALSDESYIDLPFLGSMLSEQVEEEDGAQEFQMKIANVKDMVLFDATFGD